MNAYFERFTITMTKAQALSASHPGDCQSDVTALLNVPAIARQLRKIDPALIAAELKEYGAWDEDELKDTLNNKRRIVWIAAGNIREESAENDKGCPVLFTLRCRSNRV